MLQVRTCVSVHCDQCGDALGGLGRAGHYLDLACHPGLVGCSEYPERFSPDGLTEQIIDVLLREVDGAAAVMPQPTSTLMDGRAALRRCRREARRCASAVVRALPVRGGAGGPDGWAA